MTPSSPALPAPTAATARAALAAACGAGFLWGTGALVVNVLIERHGFTPENISFWRFVVGAVVLLAVFGRRGLWAAVRPLWARVLGAGTCMAAYVLLWFLGIERIGAAIPTLIALCLPPVLVTLVALLRGQERLDATLVAILAAALAGTVMIVARHGGGAGPVAAGDFWVGVACSVGSAVLYAGFTLVSGGLSQRLGAGPATTCLTVVAAAVMGLSGLFRPLAWPVEVAPEAWFLYLGVVTAALALLAFSWGAARISPTALTVATLVEPLTAVLLAALLLGQPLGALQWAGGGLLMIAIAGLGRRVAAASPGDPR
ncbi:DMT family transporter [Piscinibacter sakaiensis]|uniref:Permease of the drug/metabolite transporter DMT superfamily n=1 Tax=Piscinibacter sakaiensis TaxID=1547922 RepID=A0A0K8NZD1_PISS1|nr:DMT family transporter [Piscinibacter sakaiensis]GAP35285.1 permease of the drug/metabolite transporter DMT superfamily [Piscinibacter sakaiensis]